MGRFTVEKGKRYRARITLGFVQRFATNDMVADKLRDVGFTDVVVTGSGGARHAEGLWPHRDATAEIPEEIAHIEQIEV
jgi:hypothetical protein